MVGDVGIEEELDLLGIQHCGGPADADKVIELKPGYALPHDKDVRRSPKTCSADGWEECRLLRARKSSEQIMGRLRSCGFAATQCGESIARRPTYHE